VFTAGSGAGAPCLLHVVRAVFGETTWNATSNGSGATFTNVTISGASTVTAACQDTAGNVGESTPTQVDIDLQQPEVLITSPGTYVRQSNVSVAGMVTDDTATDCYVCTGTAPCAQTTPLDQADGGFSGNLQLSAFDGAKSLRVDCVDRGGNLGTHTTTTTLDGTQPNILAGITDGTYVGTDGGPGLLVIGRFPLQKPGLARFSGRTKV
jgi:hypothetical protein